MPSPRHSRRALPALLAGALIAASGIIALPTVAAAAAPGAVINEVVTDNDWVELTNTSDAPIDLSGYVLKDNMDSRTLAIADGTVLAPGEFVAIDVDVDGGFGLGRNDAIRLFASDGTTLIDAHSWEEHPAPSYGRCPDGTGEFVTTVAATKGAANACTADAADTIVLNEVVSTGGVPGDWVELKNTGTVDVDAAGLVFGDNSPGNRYTLPAGSTIPAGGYLVLDEAAFGFGLGATDSAILVAADGTTVVDRHDWTAHAPTSWGRCADGVGDFALTVTVTKGAANDCPAAAEAGVVVINEIESNGDDTDWVELYNTGDTAFDLSGTRFRDNDVTREHYVLPAGSVIEPGGFFVIDQAQGLNPGFDFGLGVEDEVYLFAPDGATVIAHASWTTHAVVTYGLCPDGVGDLVDTSVSTKGAPNDCSLPVRINEIESQGGTPGDWIELINVGAGTIDLGGVVVTDSNPANTYTIPAGTTLEPQALLVLDELVGGAGDFDFGLGSSDTVTLLHDGEVLDTYSWTAHAATTYGRCPDGRGEFAVTVEPTKGAANLCEGVLQAQPWPGGEEVHVIDPGPSAFTGDLSGIDVGLDGETLWVVDNGRGILHRLVPGTGDAYAFAPGWESGAQLRYTDGAGVPDAEGVTVVDTDPDAVYVSTERNNAASSISRPSVLRYDVSGGAGELTATTEWNLAADFPGLGANQGLEGITWIPDAFLVGRGFVDERTGTAYDPTTVPGHGGGLFVIGVEGTASAYVYALQAGGAFARLATIATDFAIVADVQFDPEREALWIVCDEACNGETAVYELATVPDAAETGLAETGPSAFTASAALTAFQPTALYSRPAGMPNIANEGFAIAPQSTCVDGRKATFYADDADTDDYSLRQGSIDCTEVEDPGTDTPGTDTPGTDTPGTGGTDGGEKPAAGGTDEDLAVTGAEFQPVWIAGVLTLLGGVALTLIARRRSRA